MSRFDPDRAASLIAAARADAGLTQTELAGRVGISQPNLATMESGSRKPSADMLRRILEAADFRPSVAVSLRAPDIAAAALRHGLSNVRLFGSVIRGDDHFDSDIDVFVTAPTGAGLFPLAALASEVEEITGFPADVIADESASRTELGERLLGEAVPL